MKIAFLHYHLHPGGVTSVIRQQVEMVNRTGEVLVLSGEEAGEDFPAEVIVIPGIAYDERRDSATESEKTAHAIIDAITSKWPEGCDVLHVHNPTLAKNRALIGIIRELQKKGIRLFLQIHDFAEDGRPSFYHQDPYPVDCHYGVINSRDYRYLRSAGLKPEGLHLLPNAVFTGETEVQQETALDYIVYPVRAIRRKNIGEALLLSLFTGRDVELKITLPPGSDADLGSYRFWKEFVSEVRLNVSFEAGVNSDYPSLIGKARLVITTSITEGFGFSFLEPWIRGKPLWGRKIDGVCQDFEAKGIDLSRLYEVIQIPPEWIDRDLYSHCFRLAVRNAASCFGLPVSEEAVSKALAAVLSSPFIDFGILNEQLQADIIRNLAGRPEMNKELLRLNPFLYQPKKQLHDDSVVSKNSAIIRSNYDVSSIRRILIEIYQRVRTVHVEHGIDKGGLLSSFFNLNHFPLLKWGEYVG